MEIKNLYKKFNDKIIFSDFSASIPDNKITFIMGESGSGKTTVKALYIPSILPYFTSALISSIGLGWKAGIAAEVLCTPLNSIGKAIFESKIYFEYVDLFAWTAMVIVLSIIFEVVVTKLLKKLLSKITHKYGGKYGN